MARPFAKKISLYAKNSEDVLLIVVTTVVCFIADKHHYFQEVGSSSRVAESHFFEVGSHKEIR